MDSYPLLPQGPYYPPAPSPPLTFGQLLLRVSVLAALVLSAVAAGFGITAYSRLPSDAVHQSDLDTLAGQVASLKLLVNRNNAQYTTQFGALNVQVQALGAEEVGDEQEEAVGAVTVATLHNDIVLLQEQVFNLTNEEAGDEQEEALVDSVLMSVLEDFVLLEEQVAQLAPSEVQGPSDCLVNGLNTCLDLHVPVEGLWDPDTLGPDDRIANRTCNFASLAPDAMTNCLAGWWKVSSYCFANAFEAATYLGRGVEEFAVFADNVFNSPYVYLDFSNVGDATTSVGYSDGVVARALIGTPSYLVSAFELELFFAGWAGWTGQNGYMDTAYGQQPIGNQYGFPKYPEYVDGATLVSVASSFEPAIRGPCTSTSIYDCPFWDNSLSSLAYTLQFANNYQNFLTPSFALDFGSSPNPVGVTESRQGAQLTYTTATDSYYSTNIHGVASPCTLDVVDWADAPRSNADRSFYNDPPGLFQWVIEYFESQYPWTDAHLRSPVAAPKQKRDIARQAVLSPSGWSLAYPLRKLKVTNPLNNYMSLLFPEDATTVFYVGDATTGLGQGHLVTPGSSVTISGLPAPLDFLNGEYSNHVSLYNSGALNGLDPRLCDCGPNGTAWDRVGALLMDVNTTALAALADVYGDVYLPKGATISVNHRVTRDTPYQQFVAAAIAFQTYSMGQSGSGTFSLWSQNSDRPFVHPSDDGSWLSLVENLEHPSNTMSLLHTWIKPVHDNGVGYYHNYVQSNWGFYASAPNSAFPLNINVPDPSDNSALFYQYDVVLSNYVNASSLFALGIQTAGQASYPQLFSDAWLALPYGASFSYNYVVAGMPDDPRASVDGYLIPLVVCDTTRYAASECASSQLGTLLDYDSTVLPTPADTNNFILGGTGNDFFNAQSYYFGKLNDLVPGQSVGYIRLQDLNFVDFNYYLLDPTVSAEPPLVTVNPKASREALSRAYSPMFQWLQANTDHVVIDLLGVYRQAGPPMIALALSEFFGASRRGAEPLTVPLNSRQAPYSGADDQHFAVFNITNYAKAVEWQVHAVVNEQLYPGSVYRGSEGRVKHVVILVDSASAPSVNFFLQLMMGDLGDGALGNFVQVDIIGEPDGRFTGPDLGSDTYAPPIWDPELGFPNFLWINGAWGNSTVPAFTVHSDSPLMVPLFGPDRRSPFDRPQGMEPRCVQGYLGQSGSCALSLTPEQTVGPDYGFLPFDLAARPPLPGWTAGSPPGKPVPNDKTTFRFKPLDAALTFLRDV